MIWDPIRLSWVEPTPEEKVRQQLIRKMIRELGYPKGLIAVERDLPTGRRFDLVCYAQGKEVLHPLLLVECKASFLRGAVEQAFGYNSSIGAPFLSVASQDCIETFWWEQGKIRSVPFLPKFEELMRQVCF